MANLIREIAGKYGLIVSGTQAWGVLNGYWFQILYAGPSGKPQLTVHTAVQYRDGMKDATASAMDSLRLSGAIESIKDESGSIEIVRHPRFGGVKPAEVEIILTNLAAAFASDGAEPSCYSCHEATGSGFAEWNGNALKLCWKCIEKIEHDIHDKIEARQSEPNNYLRGIFGAVIGALIGALVWVLFGSFGRFEAVAGLAISFCAVKGYAYMKGKTTGASVALVCLISILAMVLAQFAYYDILAIRSYAGRVSIGAVIQHTFELPFMASSISQEFFKNLGLGFLFLVLGSWRVIVTQIALAKAPLGSIKRLEG